MVQNDFAPLWAVSIGVVVPLVAVVGVCICGCRKTVPKNELHGLPGMVKITNPDHEVHEHTLVIEGQDSKAVNSKAVGVDDCEANRRSSASVNRSLPAIPSSRSPGVGVGAGEADALWESEANGDTGSELYATVGDKQVDGYGRVGAPLVPSALVDQVKRRLNVDLAVLEAGGDEGEHDGDGDGDDSSHYDCLKSEHPYDKVKKSEHPYAQVQSVSTRSSNTDPSPLHHSGLEDLTDVSVGCESGSSNPVPPPRTRRSAPSGAAAAVVGEEGGVAEEVASASSIAAATAVAGHVAASQDLPYMTPPLLSTAGANFSGDSHDSKGYTSISVREPLASIKAQTKVNKSSHSSEMQDSHYATVSDDSDEMYAAIEEPVPVYNSGSETYAQIQPPAPPESLESSTYPPQPPSVDSLKHVAHAHSRQASSSSASSSVANLGSPKPEKRQANSPLPPPPCGSPEAQNSAGLNLEEMYAKVMKKKHNSSAAQQETSVPSHTVVDFQNNSTSTNDSDRLSVSISDLGSKNDSVGSECFRTEGQLSAQEKNLLRFMNVESQLPCASQQNSDPGYEVVHKHDIPEGSSLNESKGRLLNCEDEPFSSPSDSNTYNNNNSSSSSDCTSTFSLRRITNDSNNNNNNAEDDIYPKYESVLPVGFKADAGSEETSEPNYESMPSEEAEVQGDSEVDPNYEVVEHDDPNYESVSYIETNSDPPYERLHNESRDFDTEIDPDYESAGLCNSRTVEHILVKGFTDTELQNSEPGYEEIGQQNKKVWSELESKEGEGISSLSST